MCHYRIGEIRYIYQSKSNSNILLQSLEIVLEQLSEAVDKKGVVGTLGVVKIQEEIR
jgi:hypothetical protein